jgi:hypothetical protein
MPLFNVAVREHAYTGRFYSDAVQAESFEEALQVAAEHAAAAWPQPGPTPQRGFSVVVREQAYTGRFYTDAVQAESCEEALQVAAGQAAAPEPPPGPAPQPAAAARPQCADVWIHSVLHCGLEAGHDPPHVAPARGYGRPVRWVRDDRGVARALPDPASGAPTDSSITPPSSAPDGEPPEAPSSGEGSLS